MNKVLLQQFLIVVGFIAMLGLVAGQKAFGTEVKYCINHTTQEVIAVQKGYPCPYPTVEL